MTLAEVAERVEKIRASAGDGEIAHSMEDNLYADVLRSIVDDPSNAQGLAIEALRTQLIDFTRWTA